MGFRFQDQAIEEEGAALPLSPDEFAPLLAACAVDGPTAVGLSGGPDSVALTWLLAQAGLAVHAVTVDHGLRPESAEEAIQAGGLVAGFPNVVHAVLTRGGAKDQTRIMEAARRDRYRLLETYCRDKGIQALFVAHHLDDQGETLLFRLAKGSGVEGLAGMRQVVARESGLKLCRPLLTVPKARLVATCRANGLSYIEDPSNRNAAYARPRLRAAQAVLEEEGLSAKRLATVAQRLTRANQALDFYVEQAESETRTAMEPDRVVYEYKRMMPLPREIRLRLLRRASEWVRGHLERSEYGVRLERLEEIEAALFDGRPGPSRFTLGGCLFVRDPKAGAVRVEAEPAAACPDPCSGRQKA